MLIFWKIASKRCKTLALETAPACAEASPSTVVGGLGCTPHLPPAPPPLPRVALVPLPLLVLPSLVSAPPPTDKRAWASAVAAACASESLRAEMAAAAAATA
eukprot:2626296-Pyramimonas_sp.AAC.1